MTPFNSIFIHRITRRMEAQYNWTNSHKTAIFFDSLFSFSVYTQCSYTCSMYLFPIYCKYTLSTGLNGRQLMEGKLLAEDVSILISAYEQLIEVCRQKLPEEACGVLARSEYSTHIDVIIPIPNAHHKPLHSFSFHPEHWTDVFYTMQKNRQQLVGFYHSHPGTDPFPSVQDKSGYIHETGLTYWIISLKQTTAPTIVPYSSINGRFESLSLVLA